MAATIHHLREEEEDNVKELPRLTTGDPSVGLGLHGTGSTSTPLDSQQRPSSTGVGIRSTDSFLGWVANDSPGCSNASVLRDPRSVVGENLAANAGSPHSPACSTSQIPSPHLSARCTSTPPIEPPVPFVDRQLEVNKESFVDPTSTTTSDLGLLFKDMVFAQTNDILGGQVALFLGILQLILIWGNIIER